MKDKLERIEKINQGVLEELESFDLLKEIGIDAEDFENLHIALDSMKALYHRSIANTVEEGCEFPIEARLLFESFFSKMDISLGLLFDGYYEVGSCLYISTINNELFLLDSNIRMWYQIEIFDKNERVSLNKLINKLKSVDLIFRMCRVTEELLYPKKHNKTIDRAIALEILYSFKNFKQLILMNYKNINSVHRPYLDNLIDSISKVECVMDIFYRSDCDLANFFYNHIIKVEIESLDYSESIKGECAPYSNDFQSTLEKFKSGKFFITS